MKSKANNSLSKFVNLKRYTFVVPVILLAIALLVFSIWGVNRGADYKDSFTYNIHFNNTVSSSDFKEYSKIIKDTVNKESNGDLTVIVTKTNEDIASSCKVNVYNASKMTDEQVEAKIASINEIIKTQIEEKNARAIRFDNVEKQSAESYSKPLSMGLISLAVIMVLMFVYFWIRFELKMALSSLIIAPYSSISTLSLMILFRIPFTYNFMLPVLVSAFVAYILYLMVFVEIRKKMLDKVDKPNAEVVYDSIKSIRVTFLTFIIALTGVFVLLMLVLNITYITLILSLLFALVVALYSGIVLPTTMWCEIYKKQNDTRLKARLELMAKREEEAKMPKVKKDTENKENTESETNN